MNTQSNKFLTEFYKSLMTWLKPVNYDMDYLINGPKMEAATEDDVKEHVEGEFIHEMLLDDDMADYLHDHE